MDETQIPIDDDEAAFAEDEKARTAALHKTAPEVGTGNTAKAERDAIDLAIVEQRLGS